MLKKIELVNDKKLDKKIMAKIKGGWCCCASCICGPGASENWFKDDARTSDKDPLPPG